MSPQQLTLCTMDDITTSLLNMSLFPSFNLSTLFMETNAAGGIRQPKQARQNVHISGGAWASIRPHGMGGYKPHVPATEFSGALGAFLFFLSPSFVSLPVNDTDKQTENSSQNKRNTVRDSGVRVGSPPQRHFCGVSRHPPQHRAGGREAISTGSKGKDTQPRS